MRIRILLVLSIFLGLQSIAFSQENWVFSNTTPRNLVKSHYYFVNKPNVDLDVAAFTMEDAGLNKRLKHRRVKELYAILKSLHLDINNISNRRKGIAEKNKYYLFPNNKDIYLVRKDKEWFYSKKTVKDISRLYNYYVLGNKKAITKSIGNKYKPKIKLPDSIPFKLDLSTPYNCMLSFFVYIDDSLYNPSLAAKCINFDKTDIDNQEILTIKLKQIFLGSEIKIVSLEDLSKDKNYVDSISKKHIYYPNIKMKKLFLEKVKNKWLISRTSSKLISSIHKEMYDDNAEDIFQFSDKFKKWAGEKSNTKLFFLYYWQLYMILYFLNLFLLTFIVNRFIIKYLFKKFLSRRYSGIYYKLVSNLIVIIILRVLLNYSPSFEFSIGFNHIFIKLIHIVNIFFITLFSVNVVNAIIITLTEEDKYDNKFGLLFFSGLLMKLLIFIVSLMYIIQTLDFNLINFLAGLSIGGFALALGAQETVKNFFGSLMIFADQPFNVGDWIDIKGVSGTVEKVGLRSSRIRTFHNSLVTIPNSKLSDNNIDNMGKRIYRRYKTIITIEHSTDTELIDEFITQIRTVIKESKNTRKEFYFVYTNNITKYGIEILLYVFFKVPDWQSELEEKHKLIMEILRIQKEIGIKFVSFPDFIDDKKQ
jgi:MscS family membrane protein